MTKLHMGLASIAVVLAVAAAPGEAQNRVTNGSFDTGSFSGWTNEDTTTNPSPNRVVSGGTNGTAFRANLGSVQTPNLLGINQNISTSVGQNYTFSFAVRGDVVNQANSNQFQAFFGSNKVYDVTNLPNTGFQFFSFNVTATSATTNIRFAAYDVNNFIGLDEVSVITRAAAAPEPATWAMMIIGFGVVGGTLRRRQRANGGTGALALAAV